jgi:DNA invertase Pin-like site-specific DNA recombinase
MVAEFERDVISMRTKEGIAGARAKGHLKGKQPKLSTAQRKLLCHRLPRTAAPTRGIPGHLRGTYLLIRAR